MSQCAYRLRMPTLRPGAGYFVKGQLGAGGYYQVVIVDGLPVLQCQIVTLGINFCDLAGDEVDLLLEKILLDFNGRPLALTPADGNPRV